MMPASRRAWVLERHPEGTDFAGALSLHTLPLAPPAPGEVILRNHWLSMDAGTRLWMTAREDGYSPPAPLGQPMTGLTLATVIMSACIRRTSPNTVRLRPVGDHSVVMPDVGYIGEVDMAIADRETSVLRRDRLTAYHGITAVAECGRADRRGLGCGRCTGVLAADRAAPGARHRIVGSADKEWLRSEFGIAGTVSHRDPDVAAPAQSARRASYSTTSAAPCWMRCCPAWRCTAASRSAGVAGYDRDTPAGSSERQVLMTPAHRGSSRRSSAAPRINAVLAGWAAEAACASFEVVDGRVHARRLFATVHRQEPQQVLVRLD
jgi:hypothetical protein